MHTNRRCVVREVLHTSRRGVVREALHTSRRAVVREALLCSRKTWKQPIIRSWWGLMEVGPCTLKLFQS